MHHLKYLLLEETLLSLCLGFPGGSVGKASASNAGDLGSIPGLRRSAGEKWQATPVLLPGKSQGLRSLVGYIQSVGSQRVGHD